ncbi:MAG TPA: hypothetical protein PLF13_00895 [candidate division Zixibacteria bacterium]|nr:hypothetical protein [candidate division Zixibacteria bacterium]
MKSILMIIFGLSLLCLGPACGNDDDNGTGSSNGGNDTVVDSHPDPTKNISLYGVSGLSGGKIPSGRTITLSLKVLNDYGSYVRGMTNGFRIYSPDGAQWGSTSMDTTGTIGKEEFDLVVAIQYSSADGMGVDTVAFGASIMQASGIPNGFDEVALTIDIGPINSSYAGKHVCLDSCYRPPSYKWKWVVNEVTQYPTWDGPHCWEISN